MSGFVLNVTDQCKWGIAAGILVQRRLSPFNVVMTVSRNAASVAPSFSEYTLAGAKETLKILETAAEFIPIPFRGVIRVGVAVLQVCEVSKILDFVRIFC